MNEDEDLWAQYAQISKIADSYRLDDRAWAADETLNEILTRVASKRTVTANALANLMSNRARKYRMRRLSLARNAVLFSTEVANDNARLDALDKLGHAAAVLTSLEARLLFAIARGETYGELAGREAVPLGTIKTWVRRARLKLNR